MDSPSRSKTSSPSPVSASVGQTRPTSNRRRPEKARLPPSPTCCGVGRRCAASRAPRRVRLLDRRRQRALRHPAERRRRRGPAGGSSSGPASAVASANADIGLATDTAVPSGCPPRTRGCGGSARPTTSCRARACSRSRSRSTRSAGSRATARPRSVAAVASWLPQLRRLAPRPRTSTAHRAPTSLAFPRARGDPRLRRRLDPRGLLEAAGRLWRHPTIRRPSGRCTRATWMPPSPRSARCRAPRRGATTGSGLRAHPGPWAPPSRSASASPRGSPPIRSAPLAPSSNRSPPTRRARRRRRARDFPTVPGPAPQHAPPMSTPSARRPCA